MTLPNQPRALREPTRRFLAQCQTGLFVPCISSAVLEEIGQARPHIARRLLAEIDKLDPEELQSDRASEALASKYLEAGVIPAKKWFDALHVAIATIWDMDILLSWNHRHLANVRKRQLFNAANQLAGFAKELMIQNPFGVLR